MRFAGKTVLIVGGTSGIGEAAAVRFGAEGGRVFLTGRRAEVGEAVVSRIRGRGGDARFIQADIRHAADCEGMVRVVLDEAGRLDVAFNNSGIVQPSVRLSDLDETTWDEVMTVDLKGCFLAMKYELKAMLSQKTGTIVNTASITGTQGSPFAAAYSAAKHGVVGLTRSAALEYIQHGIRINAVCPGTVETDMAAPLRMDPGKDAANAARHPIGRRAAPDEIASAVLAIAADDMSFMVGQAVGVDGGRTAGPVANAIFGPEPARL